MEYGFFDDEKKEYVLKTPFTPIKWINYLGTLQFGGIMDHTGGVLMCKGDPALNRITKYIAQMPASDFKGSTIYIREKMSDGSYRIFSPFFVPVLEDLDFFECRVGLSYTRWISEKNGIRTDIRYSVPESSEVMVQDISVEILEGENRKIDVIPVLEFTHFDALKQLTNADWVPQTMGIKSYKESDGRVILEQSAYMKHGVAENYYTASLPVSSFDGDRRIFLGRNEYGSWQSPLSLQNDELSNSECIRGDNVAALMVPLGSLSQGESKRFVALMCQEKNVDNARKAFEPFLSLDQVDSAQKSLSSFWNEYLDILKVETPDAAMNSMVNIHNPRQVHTTKNWSRYLSLYQLGYGARGIGFRDSSQDLLGAISHMPKEGVEFALRILSTQRFDGSAMHQFNPITMVANEGDSREEADAPDYYGDDHLWIVLTLGAYLRETGDFKILDETIGYYKKDELGRPVKYGTVWEHLQKAIEFTWNNRGAHKLPLLGFADWNDTVNLPKGAESVFIANLFGRAVLEMIEISKAIHQEDLVPKFQKYYSEMNDALQENAWDGDWWMRYFDAEGNALGSSKNEKGQIFTNAQSWSTISGFAQGERRQKSLDSVERIMNTRFGIKLSAPGYEEYDPSIGGVTTFPPGAKENGGIFLHANPWVMIAEAIAGNGDRAFQYYDQINPVSKNDILDTYESEPYCYPQNILGDEHPLFGMGRNAWLSGTASWVYVASTQYILGVRPEMDGLRIDPCIPKKWDSFKITRKFRGAEYRVSVKNPDHVSKGVASIRVNGENFEGNLLPVFGEGIHEIEIVLGAEVPKEQNSDTKVAVNA